MPDREILCLLDLIYYQFAKILARNDPGLRGLDTAHRTHHDRVKDIFRDLKAGRKLWSEVTRGNGADLDSTCAACSSRENLEMEYLAPPSVHINEQCSSCPTLQGPGNQAWMCPACRARKGHLGLYEFFRSLLPDEDRFYRRIPPAVEKRYLKVIHDCLRCAAALGEKDLDGDGAITVLDLDHALRVHGKLGPVTSTGSITRIAVHDASEPLPKRDTTGRGRLVPPKPIGEGG